LSDDLTIRQPSADDGLAVHALIEACPPLDVNTPYCYHLLVRHFADTCLVAELAGDLVGLITGYCLPREPDVLFVWQMAVSSKARGRGLAGRLLERLVADHLAHGGTRVQTTIGPDNTASRRVFERFADARGAAHAYTPFLSGEDCGPGHEPEELLTIGPLSAAAVEETS